MIRIQANNVEHMALYYLNNMELVLIKDIVMLKAQLKYAWQKDASLRKSNLIKYHSRNRSSFSWE